MMRELLAVAVLLSTTVGCAAKLTTDVRLFDTSCLKQADILKPRIEALRAQVDGAVFEQLTADLKAKADAAWKSSGLPAGSRSSYDGSVDKLVKHIGEAKTHSVAAIKAFDKESYALAKTEIDAANAELVAMVDAYNGSLGDIFGAAGLQHQDAQALGQQVRSAQKTLAGGDLFGDPQLGLVLYAKGKDKRDRDDAEMCWLARADYTRTRASSGNADIAVNMHKDGTFTVKGLRLDASKVTQSIFKLSTQAVCVAASVAGVPGCASTAAVDTQLEDPETILLETRERQRAALDMMEELVVAPAGASDTIEAGLPALATSSEEL